MSRTASIPDSRIALDTVPLMAKKTDAVAAMMRPVRRLAVATPGAMIASLMGRDATGTVAARRPAAGGRRRGSGMYVVVSHAWTKDDGEHADAYVALSEEFARFFADHPGFRGRQLLRGVEDRTHFTNVRWFDALVVVRGVHAARGLRRPHRGGCTSTCGRTTPTRASSWRSSSARTAWSIQGP